MRRVAVAIGLLTATALRADAMPAALAPVRALVEREVAAKAIPAFAVLVIDDQRVAWQHFAGTARPDADTVYRVGSVSKLFTDLAVMKLVEAGKLRLDAPVTDYLPDFRPIDPFGGPPITLRMLMTHQAGVVREPPVGNYFEPGEPTLAATVASLNGTKLIFKPGTRVKYSNAGIAAVGRVVERVTGEPFDRHLDAALLRPFGMTHSSFVPTDFGRRHLAPARMGTWYGRDFAAPTFQLGMAPAGSMYATAGDLARFASALIAGGNGVVRRETLHEMWTPQFAEKDATTGIGLGFFLDRLDGRRKLGHSGAMYGFSTELAVLPDDKLAVVVCSARDYTHGVTGRVVTEALRAARAARAGRPVPAIPPTRPVDQPAWAGAYESDLGTAEITHRHGRTFLAAPPGMMAELGEIGGRVVTDGPMDFGRSVGVTGDELRIGSQRLKRVKRPEPPPEPPAHWLGLIGEYGWDHNELIILEHAGRLHALIEWYFLYPLTEVSADVFAFPPYGMYNDEQLVFERDATGRATRVVAASVPFARRPDAGTSPFRVDPARPIAELRAAALAATPPADQGEFAASDLVELVKLDPTIRLDVRYARADNFLGTPVYTEARAFLQRPAAEALVSAHRELEREGLGIVVYDGYRPWHVTKLFRDAVPAKFHNFVADPAQGSRHNRGCAADVGLFERATGRFVAMPSGYDEFTDRAYADYPGGTSRQRYYRERLRRVLESRGFRVYDAEWWHFDYRDWKKYAVRNEPFERIAGR